MQIVTKKIGEVIVLSEENKLVLTLLSSRNKRVRIGIDVPKNVPVCRGEKYAERKQTDDRK